MMNLITLPSLVCNPNGIALRQRESHAQLTTELFKRILSIRELEHGFEFGFAAESSMILNIAEFIANERLCCPFLNFTLEVEAENKPSKFILTGPPGTKEFLRTALGDDLTTLQTLR